MSTGVEEEQLPQRDAVIKRLVPGVGRFATISLGKYGALIVLALLVALFAVASPYYLTPTNLLEILNAAALSGIISCGLTIILVSGLFDLSLGYLATGVLTGLVNGFLVTRWHINALVATLGTGSCLVGVNYVISGGSPQDVSQNDAFASLAIGHVLGIPKLVYYLVAIAAILWVLLNKTDFGRNIQACGGNAEAARLAGVRVSLTITLGYIVVGVCAVITGLLLASSIGSGQVTAGDTFTLSSFAAAFLGSTVMREGQFHIVGTVVGVILVSAGFNGLALLGVPAYAENLFSGLLLICAVAFSSLGRSLSQA
jgi:ribose transport system permease protein